MRKLSGLALALAALNAPGVAAADSICLLGLRGDLPAPDGAAIFDAVEAGLRQDGATVVRLAEDAAELAEPLLACDGPSCAGLGLAALGCDAVAAPSAWRTPRGVELALSLVGRGGVPEELREESSAPSAAASATRLGGRGAAALPALERAASASTPDTSEDRARSPANVAVGVGLVATALVPLGFAARAVVRDGECADPTAAGVCPVDARGRYEVIAFGPRSVGLFAVGGALAAGGTFFLAARPVRVRVEGERAAVRLTVGTVL